MIYRNWRANLFSRALASAIVLTQCCRAINVAGADTPPPARSEQEWVVQETCRDLGQLLAFAEAKASSKNIGDPPKINLTRRGGTDDAPTFDVEVKTADGKIFTQSFTLNGSPWEATVEAQWAGPLAMAWKIKPTADPAGLEPDDEIISILNKPTMEIFLLLNKNLGNALNQSPASARTHEQTALLLTALAWSEAAGNFSDTRNFLNEAAAHLTIARVLRAGAAPGPVGRLAELTMLVLSGRTAEATQKIDTWAAEKNSPTNLQMTLKALALTNYGDWRKTTPAADAPLLLRRTYFRSLAENVSPDRAMHFLSTMQSDTEPDWGRIAMQKNFSVGIGNFFSEDALHHELAELSQLLENQNPKATQEASGKAVIKFLNETDQGPWQNSSLAAVPEGVWAARAQRNMLNQFARVYYHLQTMLGVPDDAAAMLKSAQPLVANLRLSPFFNFYVAKNQAEYSAAMTAVLTLLQEHPEWVSAANWRTAGTTSKAGEYHGEYPHPIAWFNPLLLNGTTFDTGERLQFADVQYLNENVVKAWLKIAPYKPSLEQTLLRIQSGEHPTAKEVRAAFGPKLEYNSVAALMLADACLDDMVAYKPAMTALCEIDSSYYMVMGNTLLEHGLNDDAAIAYQKAVDQQEDRVAVSNGMEFLVNYYLDHGRKDDAVKIAKMAGAVYSYRGLATEARLDIRMKNFSEAAQLAQNIQERYGQSGMVLVVYQAWARDSTDQKVKDEAAQKLKALFPKGLETVKLADLAKGPGPTDGTKLKAESHYTQKYGLQKDDVVVAVNGIKAHNQTQYTALLDLSPTTTCKVIAWHNGQYIETSAILPDRRFGVDVASYTP